jgi:hypothetical protein
MNTIVSCSAQCARGLVGVFDDRARLRDLERVPLETATHTVAAVFDALTAEHARHLIEPS